MEKTVGLSCLECGTELVETERDSFKCPQCGFGAIQMKLFRDWGGGTPIYREGMGKMDWNKLTTDLREANEAAKAAADEVPDGGTANLDRVFLALPRKREEKALQAIRDAGLYCRKKTNWIGPGYMITPTSGGQADKRYEAVSVMCEELRRRGWEVVPFRKAD